MLTETEPVSAGPTSPTQAQLAAVFVVFFALGFATASLGAGLPGLRHTFHQGPDAGGDLVSTYNLGALAAIIACGLGNRRFAPRGILRCLLALFAVGAIAMGLTSAWPLFYAATLVAGIGYGGLVLYLNSIVARSSDGHSFLMLSLINAVFGAGAILGPLVAGTGDDRPQMVFLIAGVLALLGGRVCSIDQPGRAAAGAEQPRPGGPRRYRLVLTFLALGFCYAGLETGTGAWEATQLAWSGHSAQSAARIASLFWLGLCAGRFLLPVIMRKSSPQNMVRAALLAALGAFAAATAPALSPYAYAACGLFLAPVIPAVFQWIAQSVEDNHGANSMLLTASMAGSVVLPALIGAIAHPTIPAAVPICLAFLALLGAGTAQILVRTGPPQALRH